MFFFSVPECSDGLCCKLTEVCGKPRSLAWALERGKEDEFSIPRDSLNLIKRIGGGQFADVWLGKLHLCTSFVLTICPNMLEQMM